MNKILIDRSTVEQALEALDGVEALLTSMDVTHLLVYEEVNNAITALKAALAEEALQRLTDVSQEIEAALAEPVQQGCDHCNHPLYAAVKCRVCGRVTEPTPPQRKPLAEWQINDLMADIDPEDRDSWSFRQGVYAAEKHHGVRK